ncbi:MAG: 4-alpha-glucanotransferase [Candidatus Omnitrophica bacterium]|nr:4-alpha-glucanotransferase [Candidatus Omnitrophota bacterium]
MNRRASGILLHITSLASGFGIGDLGPQAYKFADFLKFSKQSYWQILPLNPTDPVFDNSPYSSNSAFGANSLLISPELLVKDGLLSGSDIKPRLSFSKNQCDYLKVTRFKKGIFSIAYNNFIKDPGPKQDFEKFCKDNQYWLEDFSIFRVVKRHIDSRPWGKWTKDLRDRKPQALNKIKNDFKNEISKEKFLQFVFFKQWFCLKQYCNNNGIKLIGDIPIYVSYDSADVWSNPDFFKLNTEKMPSFVAGVPPDYFSKTGQRWGNPIYRWEILKKNGFKWWFQRLRFNSDPFDIIRIDHFRGLVAYWQIPSEQKTAIKGQWVKAPAYDFFRLLKEEFPDLSIIAEDLGYITDDVRAVIKHFGFPGMRILLFGFDADLDKHPYLPHNFIENCVAYTGTHDNNTIKGWFKNEASRQERQNVFKYLGKKVSLKEINWEFIKLLMFSVANTVIIPMQDILGLGEEARMNLPATKRGNWRWRLDQSCLKPQISKRLLEITKNAKRS